MTKGSATIVVCDVFCCSGKAGVPTGVENKNTTIVAGLGKELFLKSSWLEVRFDLHRDRL